MSAGSPTEHRDWSELPGELLDAIMRRLTKLPDVIRFQAVCKPWKHAVLDQEQNPPKFRQSLPWQLTLPFHDSGCHSLTDVVAAETNDYGRHVHLPRRKRKQIFEGSAFGWLLVKKYPRKSRRWRLGLPPTLYLLNPLTGNKINLPKITERGPFGVDIMGFAMSAEPAAAAGGCVVAVFYDDTVAFCKLRRDRRWTLICLGEDIGFLFFDIEDLDFHCAHNWGCVFWRDQIHVVCYDRGKGLAWDHVVAGPNEADNNKAQPMAVWASVGADMADRLRHSWCRLVVVSPEGELVLVAVRERSYGSYDGRLLGPRFKALSCRVYKLNEEGKRWEEVDTVGDYALFVDVNGVIYVPIKDHPEVRKNCVYYEEYVLDLNNKEFELVVDWDHRKPDYSLAWVLPSNY